MHLCTVAIICVDVFKKWRQGKETAGTNVQLLESGGMQLFQATVTRVVQQQNRANNTCAQAEQMEGLDQIRGAVQKIEKDLAELQLEFKSDLQSMREMLLEMRQAPGMVYS